MVHNLKNASALTFSKNDNGNVQVRNTLRSMSKIVCDVLFWCVLQVKMALQKPLVHAKLKTN